MFAYYSNIAFDIWLIWLLFTASVWLTMKAVKFWLKVIRKVRQ